MVQFRVLEYIFSWSGHFNNSILTHQGSLFMDLPPISKKNHFFIIYTKIVQRKSASSIIDIRPPISFWKSVGDINNVLHMP